MHLAHRQILRDCGKSWTIFYTSQENITLKSALPFLDTEINQWLQSCHIMCTHQTRWMKLMNDTRRVISYNYLIFSLLSSAASQNPATTHHIKVNTLSRTSYTKFQNFQAPICFQGIFRALKMEKIQELSRKSGYPRQKSELWIISLRRVTIHIHGM